MKPHTPMLILALINLSFAVIILFICLFKPISNNTMYFGIFNLVSGINLLWRSEKVEQRGRQ